MALKTDKVGTLNPADSCNQHPPLTFKYCKYHVKAHYASQFPFGRTTTFVWFIFQSTIIHTLFSFSITATHNFRTVFSRINKVEPRLLVSSFKQVQLLNSKKMSILTQESVLQLVKSEWKHHGQCSFSSAKQSAILLFCCTSVMSFESKGTKNKQQTKNQDSR